MNVLASSRAPCSLLALFCDFALLSFLPLDRLPLNERSREYVKGDSVDFVLTIISNSTMYVHATKS